MKWKLVAGVSLIIYVVCLFGCMQPKVKLNKIPVAIQDAYYERLITGVRVTIPLSSFPRVELECIYFLNRSTELKQSKDNPLVYEAFFERQIEDLIMDKNPFKEYGNQLKSGNEASPVKLKANECLISYINTKNSCRGFFKYSRVKEKKKDF